MPTSKKQESVASERLQRRLNESTSKKLRVAIVGTGIAGETAAYLLTQPMPFGTQTVEVARVYEARGCPGLHVNSIEVDGYHVDVPLRAVSPHYYANLFALYQRLGVTMQHVDYSSCTSEYEKRGTTSQSQSASPPPADSRAPTTDAAQANSSSSSSKLKFRYCNFLIMGHALPCLVWSDVLCLTRLLFIFRILRDLFFLVLTGPWLLSTKKAVENITLGSYLRQHNYSFEFVQEFLYPMLSTMLSCSYAQVDQYPARYILEFFCSRSTALLTGWYRVRNGVQEVSAKLLHNLPREALKLNAPVRSVEYDEGRDMVRLVEANGQVEYFDAVLIATEPSVAQKIWKGCTADETTFIHAMKHYDANITVHTDSSLMPANRADWRGMNVFTTSSGGGASSPLRTTAEEESDAHRAGGMDRSKRSSAASMTSARLSSYHQGLGRSQDGEDGGADDDSAPSAAKQKKMGSPTSPRKEFIETWNPFESPEKASIVHDVRLTRAVWDMDAKVAFDGLFQRIQGARGVFITGSYAEPGITLLEQAVTSACRTSQIFGVTVPFAVRPCYEQHWVVVCASAVLYWLWRCLNALSLTRLLGL